MAYIIETLIWQSYTIEVKYDPDPFNLVSHTGEAMSHIEIRTLIPENAALPITETGYKSHFSCKYNIDDYEKPVAFVKEWLDHAAQSKEWKDIQGNEKQMSLF